MRQNREKILELAFCDECDDHALVRANPARWARAHADRTGHRVTLTRTDTVIPAVASEDG